MTCTRKRHDNPDSDAGGRPPTTSVVVCWGAVASVNDGLGHGICDVCPMFGGCRSKVGRMMAWMSWGTSSCSSQRIPPFPQGGMYRGWEEDVVCVRLALRSGFDHLLATGSNAYFGSDSLLFARICFLVGFTHVANPGSKITGFLLTPHWDPESTITNVVFRSSLGAT